MNLDEKIKKIRKDNKLSQDNLAEILNVTRQTVSNWENAKNYPDIETLIKISDKFNISLDNLLKGDIKLIKDFDSKIKNNRKLKTIIKVLTFVIIAVVLVPLIVVLTKDKELDLYLDEDIREINDVYFDSNYSDIFYQNKDLFFDDLSYDDTMFLASTITPSEAFNTLIEKPSDYGRTMCVFNEKSIVNSENLSDCIYATIKKEDINKSFKRLFNKSISEYKTFYDYDDYSIHLLYDNIYYSGKNENSDLIERTKIYDKGRNIKAVKKFNGDIVIYATYFKVKKDRCYINSTDKNEACTEELLKNKDNVENLDLYINKLSKKYITNYKHTFKKSKSGYYWHSTKIIK